jgi:hypothetical protein
MSDVPSVVRRAFYDAQKRRPYAMDAKIVEASTPSGGDWRCVAEPGAISRSIMWRGTEVAHVNPRGQLDDATEGQIAMAIAAVPALDAGMRAILVLAEDAENLLAIRELATSLVAFIEIDAPKMNRPGAEDGDDPDGEQYEDEDLEP